MRNDTVLGCMELASNMAILYTFPDSERLRMHQLALVSRAHAPNKKTQIPEALRHEGWCARLVPETLKKHHCAVCCRMLYKAAKTLCAHANKRHERLSSGAVKNQGERCKCRCLGKGHHMNGRCYPPPHTRPHSTLTQEKPNPD